MRRAGRDGTGPESPTRRLLLAVLEQTLVDYVHGRPDVARWLESPEADRPMAFAAICDVFGVDPGEMRDAVLNRRASFRRQRW